MVTPNERVALEIVAEEGGKAGLGKLSARMGLGTHILGETCKSLHRRGYVELPGQRIITLTTKGLQAGGKGAEEGLKKLTKYKDFDEQTLREIEPELRKSRRGWTQIPVNE